MLSAFGRVIKTADLRRKLLFTLGMIVLYRMGTFIPAPGISYGTVQQCLNANQTHGGAYDIINLFSGGALLQLSIFALGVMPYITASIIIQLLRVVIPRFQELHDEGAQGQAKLTQYTRYLTIALALLNATTIVSMARSGVLLGTAPVSSRRTTCYTSWLLSLLCVPVPASSCGWASKLLSAAWAMACLCLSSPQLLPHSRMLWAPSWNSRVRSSSGPCALWALP